MDAKSIKGGRCSQALLALEKQDLLQDLGGPSLTSHQ